MKLDEISIAQLRDGLRRGEFSSEDLVRTYIKRIEEVNSTVRAVSEINRKAIEIAKEKDRERCNGAARGILHGIPILVKNIFLTTDGMQCTFGFSGLLGAVPSIEATTVVKLRKEGAIILGIANASQFANMRKCGGWSADAGQCLGIYYEDQAPSGSSSGSAVAAALGLCAAALGTETKGSICSPAEHSAVVGIKPTVGLTSRYGVYNASHLQDTVGPLARSVRDAALVLTAIAGIDENDFATHSYPELMPSSERPKEGTDFTKACSSLRLDGLRIAIPRHLLKDSLVSESHLETFERAVEVVKTLGAEIIDPVCYSKYGPERTPTTITDDEYAIAFKVDIYHNMKKSLSLFSTNPNNIHTFEDVNQYIRETPKEELSIHSLDRMEDFVKVGQEYAIDSELYKKSMLERNEMAKQIPKLLERYTCDAIMLPTKVATEPASVGGCPIVTVPMGWYGDDVQVERSSVSEETELVVVAPNIPLGVSFVGKRWDDYRLISIAYAFEQATKHRSNGRPVIVCETELPLHGK